MLESVSGNVFFLSTAALPKANSKQNARLTLAYGSHLVRFTKKKKKQNNPLENDYFLESLSKRVEEYKWPEKILTLNLVLYYYKMYVWPLCNKSLGLLSHFEG